MTPTTTTTELTDSLALLAWYVKQGNARRRALCNVARRRTPAVIVWHPDHGYATVSAASFPRYAELGCERVEDVTP